MSVPLMYSYQDPRALGCAEANHDYKDGCCGADQMGAGIAQVAAVNGFSVIWNDVSEAYLKGGIRRTEKSLLSFLNKGRITKEEKRTALGRIQTTVGIKAFETAGFVGEAVIEEASLKVNVFRDPKFKVG